MEVRMRPSNTSTDATDKAGSPPGPVPIRVRADGEFEDVVRRALNKPKPPNGWPKPEPKKRAAKKKRPRGK
jgi:hypothetical protein